MEEEKRPRRYSNAALGRRILIQAAPQSGYLVAILVVDALATPLMLLNPIPLQLAVDSILGSHPLPALLGHLLPAGVDRRSLSLLLLVCGLQVLIALATRLQELVAHVLRSRAGELMTLRFREQLFSHAQRLSLAFHDARGSADSIYRIEYDAASVHYLVVYALLSSAAAGVALVATFVVVARIDWRLALVALGVTPFLALLALTYDRRMRPHYRAVKDLESGALEIVQEVLGALRVVKAFGREGWEGGRFRAQSRQGVRARTRQALAEGVFGILVNGAIGIGTAAVLFLGIGGVEAGRLTLGQLLVVLSYLAQLYAPLETVTTELAGMQTSLASAERAFELLDELPEVAERPGARRLRRARGEVEFREVSFAYDPLHPVLHGVSFRIEPGGWLGVSGPTGAGKTTLVSLLARFYDPSGGQILLDGLDLRDYVLQDLRRQLTIVLQEPTLLSCSIAQNIAYGRPYATRAEIEAAARAANAHDFVSALPDGYDTLVGERGMLLSGGERQRVGLARAFVRDAPILVLDEPTSSVDVGTEAGIMQAMDRLMAGRTTLMIAHRLSTLDACDLRLELEHGRVARWRQGSPALRAAGGRPDQ
jgi:ATP-binding cassette subfamily B protein